MKTYKVELTEEFIKEAYVAACDEWRTKIKDLVPEAFGNKLEAKEWYRFENFPKALVFFNSINKHSDNYGFNLSGKWTNVFSFKDLGQPIKATDKEVEEALIKEAKKRGFVEGVRYNYPDKPHIETREITSSEFEYDKDYNVLKDNGNGNWVFHDGKWAEPIEDNTEKRKRNYILQKIEEMEEQLNELKKEL